ncbi:MAG: RNA methyltransferase [Chloroflexi bacterium]|nr:RNA methyltransferase [Chloroflexota bacterium]
MYLTSPNNPKIKQIRALRRRKGRERSDLLLVEGIRPVGEAVEAGASVAYLCYAPERLTSEYARQLIRAQQARGVPVYAVSAEVFQTLADKENPQGIIAVIHRPHLTLEDLTADNSPWTVALVSPQDPGNIGTILRTMDAVGANALLLLDQSADPYHPKAVRASMGTLFWHPVVMTTFDQFVRWAQTHGYHIYGTSAHGNTSYQQVLHYERPAVLLLGSEREGLSVEQAACCEQLIRLPMCGRATSLNLAVAAGVMLYAMLEKFGICKPNK